MPLNVVLLFGLIKTEDIKKMGMVQKGIATVLKTCYETRAGSHHGQSRKLPPKRADNRRQHQVCSACARLAVPLSVREKAKHVAQP